MEIRIIGKSFSDDAAYSHHCNTQDGIIVCYEIDKTRDDHAGTTGAAGEKRLCEQAT